MIQWRLLGYSEHKGSFVFGYAAIRKQTDQESMPVET